MQLGDAAHSDVYGEIESYTVDSQDGDTVKLTVKYRENTLNVDDYNGYVNTDFDVKVTLKKNPYSVMDGYSVTSISKIKTKETITPY